MIDRKIKDQIMADYHRKKVIVLLGARQVGKTTLLSQLKEPGKRILSLNCDDYDDAQQIEGLTSTQLREHLSPYDIVFIDEAQRVDSIGLTLKKIGDLKLDTQVIVTGSSSLDMASGVNESATGRLIEYNLYPLSLAEMASSIGWRETHRLLPTRLVYGMYPEVINDPGDARRILATLTNSYLYKDLLSYKGIKKPEMVHKLVKALALQIGSEVSYNELSNLIGVDRATVETYIGLLEKCFILFRQESYSRNMRNEIKKGKKVYFYDLGIRNAVIGNFAPLDSRNDVGALWENMMVVERLKRNAYCQDYSQSYFWRTLDNCEIDLIEEKDGQLAAFEMKWNPKAKVRTPKSFMATYPDSTFQVINPDTYQPFVE
ncbi:MAG: ATP-binding protein [Bacteroidales bacterium]|nr:ATP-binding protein [Bacteroidales bacterium]